MNSPDDAGAACDRVLGYRQGFNLSGTPLWIDARRQRELCLVTSLVARCPPAHRRLLASSSLAQALRALGCRAGILPSPYGRWIGVGGQRVQLLDAGARPGAAYALVDHMGTRLLVCGLLRRQQRDWPFADHLVAEVPAVFHAGVDADRVAEALCSFVDEATAEGERAGILVEAAEVGFEILRRLKSLGRAVRPLGLLGRLAKEGSARTTPVSMGLVGQRLHLFRSIVGVDTGLGAWRTLETQLSVRARTVSLGWYADLRVLVAAVVGSGVKAATLAGVPQEQRHLVRQALPPEVQVVFVADAKQLDLP